ncbi:MAG: D-alanyl-D-alanine carboxypeptidase/D-alanyl-D-alanine-endopeptidase [Rhodobacteraceae bacterium]|nr:D-alanyl-D-alanine carboxypeptidase/D-alanyl-D-alanine-endopeptidase [Paracoccaceae bacterium]
MKRHLSRRFFLGGAAVSALGGPALAFAPEQSLRPVARGDDLLALSLGGVDQLVAGYNLTGTVGLSVADVRTGLELETLNPSTGLPPASVTKSLTALYALNALGPDYRFQTRLLARGKVADGVLQGDLVLQGGGDPTLDTDALATLAANLKAGGIREVRGDFVVDEGFLPYVPTIDPEQLVHVGYSPAVSGIALNYNRVHFEWRRGGSGYTVTMDARTDRYRPDVAIARMRVADRSVPVYTYADRDGIDDWTVARGALGNGGARWLPVRRPGAYVGDVFRTLARAQGIVLKPVVVSKGVTGQTTELVRFESEPLTEILRDMLKWSTNLTAEMVGLTATVARGWQPATLADSAARMSAWARQELGMTEAALVDHSGLGVDSRMSARDLTTALVRVRQEGILRPLLKRIAMRDSQGRTVGNHPIRVDAKTGTLFFVSALAGFMTAQDGTELAFAILTADTDRRAKAIAAGDERPPGARGWNGTSKRMQQALIDRWGLLYGS